jgi:DNA polymerase elongation subunit (family B)
MKPKILILDIETFPNLGYTWQRYEQNVIRFTQEKCIATFSAKWLGQKKVISKSLPQYPGYAPGSYDDKALCLDLHKFFDYADVIVAHNGDQFDVRFAQSRFIFHGFRPPSPFKTVDTKKVAKRVANFNSNKLDDLGKILLGTQKIKTDFDLWEGCIKGDPKAWKRMIRYNEKDVLMLERLYLRLLPWCKNHPNFTGQREACPKCASFNIHWKGVMRTTTRSYFRFQCQDCGGWGKSMKSMLEKASTTSA